MEFSFLLFPLLFPPFLTEQVIEGDAEAGEDLGRERALHVAFPERFISARILLIFVDKGRGEGEEGEEEAILEEWIYYLTHSFFYQWIV